MGSISKNFKRKENALFLMSVSKFIKKSKLIVNVNFYLVLVQCLIKPLSFNTLHIFLTGILYSNIFRVNVLKN